MVRAGKPNKPLPKKEPPGKRQVRILVSLLKHLKEKEQSGKLYYTQILVGLLDELKARKDKIQEMQEECALLRDVNNYLCRIAKEANNKNRRLRCEKAQLEVELLFEKTTP